MIKKILKTAAILLAFFMVVGISGYLTLSLMIKSEDTVIVPELTGKDVYYALKILSELELNTKVVGSEYSAVVPENHVIYQEPEPGYEIKKGRDVKLTVSQGEATVLLPNLKGLLLQQAGIILEENDLFYKTLSLTYSKGYRKDEIIAQVPCPGTTIKRNGSVDLLVSMGERPVAYKMPDLKGFSLDQAILQIEENSLEPGEIKSTFKKNRVENIIVEQEPRAGYAVSDGDTVNLVINRRPGKKNRKRLIGAQGIRLFRYRTESGFLQQKIRATLNCRGVSNNIFDSLAKPGEEIWLPIPNNIEATLFLYKNDELVITKVFDSW